jgi:hypothetical protein
LGSTSVGLPGVVDRVVGLWAWPTLGVIVTAGVGGAREGGAHSFLHHVALLSHLLLFLRQTQRLGVNQEGLVGKRFLETHSHINTGLPRNTFTHKHRAS